jgi:hypothetical protein
LDLVNSPVEQMAEIANCSSCNVVEEEQQANIGNKNLKRGNEGQKPAAGVKG